MCGIVGYIGHRDAYPVIINGLKRLEYRGYDSAGIALYDGTEIQLAKTKGKVVDLEERVSKEISKTGTVGIGHTRWATHGVPNDVNSHPHYSNSGDLVIIHNGIIENYASVKKELINRGYTFSSDTDTEVLVNLIEEIKKKQDVKLGKAVQLALNEVVGAYAIAVFDKNKPDEIVVAKLGSPLAIGIGDDEYPGSPRQDDRTSYNLGLVYDWKRWVSVGASYRYTDRDSNQNILDMEKNVFLVNFDMTL